MARHKGAARGALRRFHHRVPVHDWGQGPRPCRCWDCHLLWNELVVKPMTGRSDRSAHALLSDLRASIRSSVAKALALTVTMWRVGPHVRPPGGGKLAPKRPFQMGVGTIAYLPTQTHTRCSLCSGAWGATYRRNKKSTCLVPVSALAREVELLAGKPSQSQVYGWPWSTGIPTAR